MKSIARFSFLVSSALVLGPGSAMGAMFTDQTFDPGDWSQLILSQTGPAPTFSTGQSLAGGNPGAYRSISHVYGGFGSIITGHIFEDAAYNPGLDGALGSVTFAFDAKVFEAGQSGAVGFGALLRQSGSYYMAGFSSVLPGGWTNQSYIDLSAANFALISGAGPALPDFSAAGAEIKFGFFASNGTGLSTRTSTSSGVDNWSVTTTAAAVPEGGNTQLHVIGGLLALALWRRNFGASR